MEDVEDKFEKIEKEINENFIKAENLLKEYLKTSYENSGKEWTEKNDEEIHFIMKSIEKMAFLRASKTLMAYNEKMYNLKKP